MEKTYHVWSSENFAWIRQVSTRNYRWCSNLIWKKVRLPHLEPLCRTGWWKKSIYFAYKMNSCMHFMHPSKIIQIGWGHHVDFCVWKNRPLLLAKGVHPCSKVIGIYFLVSNDGIYFQCIDLKFFMMHDEVFCIHCGKYHECMYLRHACVNTQTQ